MYTAANHKEFQMKTIQVGNNKFLLMVAVFMVLFGGGCGGGGSSDIVVEAPGVPTNFTVIASSSGGDLSATLAWSAPATGGELSSYEIYRITTDPTATDVTVFDSVNHLISLPVTTFEFIDNAGLERGQTTQWIITAKNAGGETPTLPGAYTPQGGGAGEVDAYGNNFAAATIFADGYGISGAAITGSWTKVIADIDYNTGLRPVIDENSSELPYLDPATTYILGGVTYYKQKTASTWQGEWQNGAGTDQNVTAKWGDNLISQSLTTESIIRVEMVLTEELDTNMTSYNMVSLYGTEMNEIYGTDGVEYNSTTAFVFATNAHLKIQEVDENGIALGAEVVNQTLFDPGVPDGPGKFGAEINVAGNLTYGYVWNLKENPVPAGIYRITFSLDGISAPTSTNNNTFIDTAANGVLDSSTSVHIDVNIGQ